MAAVGALRDEHAGLVGRGDELEQRMRGDILGAHLRIARMRRVEHVVEPADERRGRLEHAMREHARAFLGKLVLVHAVMVEDAGLRAPADVQSGVHVGLAPCHDAAQLVPVVDILEIEQFNRCARDDQAVEALLFDLVERTVEHREVLFGHILRFMACHAQKLDIDLQGRVRELAQDLGLGDDLGRHEVQKQKAQRTDVLMHGAMLGDDEYVLVLQNAGCGKQIGDLDGHGGPFCRRDGGCFGSKTYSAHYTGASLKPKP